MILTLWDTLKFVCLLVLFVFVTPEGFTTVVVNEDLEKARAYVFKPGPLGPMALHHLQTTPTHFLGQS